MSSRPWSRLPDPCILTVFKHFTLIELFRTIRLVCSRWSQLASSELSQRHTLMIASWCLFPPYNVLPLNPSTLLKHLRDNDGQSLKVKYLKPIDDRAIVNLDYGEKNVFQGPFVTVMLNNLPNITNLTLWFYYVHKRENPSKCEFTQLIRILSQWKNSLLDLSLYLSYEYRIIDEQSEPNVETLYKSINQLESLKHLKLDLKIRRCDDSQFIPTPKLTILSQLKTFTFSSWYDDNVQAALLNQLENDCPSCKIGCEVRYLTLRDNGHFELDQIARLAKELFRDCVQLHTVEFNDGPFRMLNRKLVSRRQYFAEPVEISHKK